MTGVRYDAKSYRAGYVAGLLGRRNQPGPEIRDSLAFRSAYIEGKAVRLSGALRFRRWRSGRPEEPPWWFLDAWPIVPATVGGRPIPRK